MHGCSTYARIVSQEKTRKSPHLGRATSVQYCTGVREGGYRR